MNGKNAAGIKLLKEAVAEEKKKKIATKYLLKLVTRELKIIRTQERVNDDRISVKSIN